MKLIIENKTKISDLEEIDLVRRVIELGKISHTKKGKQYCFLSMYDYKKNQYSLIAIEYIMKIR